MNPTVVHLSNQIKYFTGLKVWFTIPRFTMGHHTQPSLWGAQLFKQVVLNSIKPPGTLVTLEKEKEEIQDVSFNNQVILVIKSKYQTLDFIFFFLNEITHYPSHQGEINIMKRLEEKISFNHQGINDSSNAQG